MLHVWQQGATHSSDSHYHDYTATCWLRKTTEGKLKAAGKGST